TCSALFEGSVAPFFVDGSWTEGIDSGLSEDSLVMVSLVICFGGTASVGLINLSKIVLAKKTASVLSGKSLAILLRDFLIKSSVDIPSSCAFLLAALNIVNDSTLGSLLFENSSNGSFNERAIS